eukprot:3345649-Amphidinium_carterae.1
MARCACRTAKSLLPHAIDINLPRLSALLVAAGSLSSHRGVKSFVLRFLRRRVWSQDRGQSKNDTEPASKSRRFNSVTVACCLAVSTASVSQTVVGNT